MGQVATTPTPISQGQALGYLLAAGCPQNALLMVAAQSAVETAAWGSQSGRGFNNNNFGNITPSNSQLASGIDWMDQGISGMKYISYSDAVKGATDYINFLQARGLFQFAVNGDLDGYTGQLANICYLGCIGNTDPTGHTVSQSDYSNYEAGISGWMNRLSGVQPIMPSGATTMTGSNLALTIGGGVLILGAAGFAAWVMNENKHHAAGYARENPTTASRCPTGSKVQSLLFSRSEYTHDQAKSCARSHGYKSNKADVTGQYVHLTQAPSSRFQRIRTVPFGHGIEAHVGWARC